MAVNENGGLRPVLDVARVPVRVGVDGVLLVKPHEIGPQVKLTVRHLASPSLTEDIEVAALGRSG